MPSPPAVTSSAVGWASLVTAHAPAAHPYLDAIAEYSNAGDDDRGVFARRFGWRSDPAFAERLAALARQPTSAAELLSPLLARTALAEALVSFHADRDALATALAVLPIAPVGASAVVGLLTDYLYGYGMYRHFRDDHTRDEADALAQAFVHGHIGDDLDAYLVLVSINPWGRWFDPHSCSDLTVLMLDRKGRRGILAAFSHSD